ncbi:PBSX family phage terminase large subunit [Enterococcus avium]|uniref:PBSX family phage terminase large subunit n=1 Tax=Enterococcus avium TaxID=33945 RepID=A0ABD5F530_ENTAV|nr:PBSX family phage terminase large subunit [Enterococcus avium]MDT2484130.1 PBSX family phage terminase large subunit [Enterococcus avium]MDT2510680.1 PBSX family phage terminase large subunit [Enterococcus avium]MDT2513359.1 PBSX family phage terminase large subunit [Enterococcus avium]
MSLGFSSSRDVISKHKPLFDRIAGKNDIDTFVLSGGRASFKSYDICLAIIMDILIHAEKGQQANAVVFMQKKEEIRDGVHKQFETVTEDLGIENLFKVRYQPLEIKFLQNDSVIKFYGLNKQEGKKANAIDNIAWLWFEEFDQFQSQESVDPTLDTFMRHAIKGERIKTVYSFNPPRSRHHWVFEYLRKLNAERIHTTYLDDDTGKNLLPTQMLEKIEATKESDPSWYSWNYLGIVPKDVETDFPSLIEASQELDLGEDDYIFVGIDSATRGKDGTRACAVAYNKATLEIKLLGFESFDDVWVDGYTSQKVGADIANFVRSINANAVYVDPMQGQHIIDYLAVNVPEIITKAVNFGSKVSDYAKGKAVLAINRRAEMYVNTSDQLKSKRVVAYCDKSELERQLNATEFEVDAKKIKVIEKDIIKQRIGKSPDEADGFVLAIQSVYETMNL